MIDKQQVEAVLIRIATKHYVSVERIKSAERNRWVVSARRAAAQELYDMGMTPKEIGFYLNKSYASARDMLGFREKRKDHDDTLQRTKR